MPGILPVTTLRVINRNYSFLPQLLPPPRLYALSPRASSSSPLRSAREESTFACSNYRSRDIESIRDQLYRFSVIVTRSVDADQVGFTSLRNFQDFPERFVIFKAAAWDTVAANKSSLSSQDF